MDVMSDSVVGTGEQQDYKCNGLGLCQPLVARGASFKMNLKLCPHSKNEKIGRQKIEKDLKSGHRRKLLIFLFITRCV